MPESLGPNVISLEEVREQRRYIKLAYASPAWPELKAFMSLSGFELTDENAEQLGRLIAQEEVTTEGTS